MGLDITAYKNLQAVEKPERDENGELVNESTQWEPRYDMEWSEKHFKGRAEGIDPEVVYAWDEELHFRAGSYSTYNVWRDCLETFAKSLDEGAFYELIMFADNEGVIGPIVSKKLLHDFTRYYKRAKIYANTLGDDAQWWFERYELWQEAFTYASDNGAVVFA